MCRYPFGDGTSGLKKGPWTQEEDEKLLQYIEKHNGHGSWSTLPKRVGLNRCGKSCRLRWINYLRPDLKRGEFSHEEEKAIIKLHSVLGNKWSRIASKLPGRTDNEIKNYWNTSLRKKLLQRGLHPTSHTPLLDYRLLANLSVLVSASNMPKPWENAFSSHVNSTQLATTPFLQNIIDVPKGPINVPQFDGIVPYNSDITQSHHEDPRYTGKNPQPLDNLSCNDDFMTCYGNGFQVPQVLDATHNFSKSNHNYLHRESDVLPGLVPDSEDSSNVTKIPSYPAYPSSVSTNCAVFEALEKFLNDEASWQDTYSSLSSYNFLKRKLF